MGEESVPAIRIEVTESDDIDELIIAFRRGDEVIELAGKEPPVMAELKQL